MSPSCWYAKQKSCPNLDWQLIFGFWECMSTWAPLMCNCASLPILFWPQNQGMAAAIACHTQMTPLLVGTFTQTQKQAVITTLLSGSLLVNMCAQPRQHTHTLPASQTHMYSKHASYSRTHHCNTLTQLPNQLYKDTIDSSDHINDCFQLIYGST